ncbi:hypothetical protein [Dyella silvae]|nr:hypothetical protein [Dyella silvae]
MKIGIHLPVDSQTLCRDGDNVFHAGMFNHETLRDERKTTQVR